MTTDTNRRGLLARAISWLMMAGLLGGYGACAAMGGRFLFPARPRARRWIFAARVRTLVEGDAVGFRTPEGERVTIARQGSTGGVEDFVALSSTCPHLGCQVHWQAARNRFFCPCHNGVFSPSGVALSGPPADAGQSLARFPLRIEGELLLVAVPDPVLTTPRNERA